MTVSDAMSGQVWGGYRSGVPRVPDFFIVGQPRSGTTALYEMLRWHPEIFMADPKEPLFLANDMRHRFYRPRVGLQRIHLPRVQEYLAALPSTLEEYLALFEAATPDQQLGEASVLYLFSRSAAASIQALNPASRIIAIFREPASFLRSYHLLNLQTRQENEPNLIKAMALEAARARRPPRGSFRPQELLYSRHVRYAEQLRRYHAAFHPEQVLTLIYDDYRADNESTVRRIFDFLGVDSSVPVMSIDANPTVTLRSQLLDDLIDRFSVGRGPISRKVKSGIKASVAESTRRRLLQTLRLELVQSPPPVLEDELMAKLRVSLRPEVERFSEYLDRDLVRLWGYDHL
jgi:hypothetical protein